MFRLYIFNSDNREIYTLFKRILLFLSPFLVSFILFEWGMYRFSESRSYDYILKEQQSNSKLITSRLFLSQQFNVYKSKAILLKKPSILILGSSRVMQFRDFMFHPMEDEFYNAGGMIKCLNDLVEFSKRICDGDLPSPRAIILGVNPWILKRDSRDKTWMTKSKYLSDEAYSVVAHLLAARRIFMITPFPWYIFNPLQINEHISPIYRYPTAGLQAMKGGSAFRADGSVLYEFMLADYMLNPIYIDRHGQDQITSRIPKLTAQFSYSPSYDSSKVDLLVATIHKLQERGIEVYSILPPFTSEAINLLDGHPIWFPWWIYYRHKLASHLENEGIVCVDVSSPMDYGLDDRYMYDAFHPGEQYNSYLLEELLNRVPESSYLKQIDIKHLQQLRSNPRSLKLCFFKPIIEGRSDIFQKVRDSFYH